MTVLAPYGLPGLVEIGSLDAKEFETVHKIGSADQLQAQARGHDHIFLFVGDRILRMSADNVEIGHHIAVRRRHLHARGVESRRNKKCGYDIFLHHLVSLTILHPCAGSVALTALTRPSSVWLQRSRWFISPSMPKRDRATSKLCDESPRLNRPTT